MPFPIVPIQISPVLSWAMALMTSEFLIFDWLTGSEIL